MKYSFLILIFAASFLLTEKSFAKISESEAIELVYTHFSKCIHKQYIENSKTWDDAKKSCSDSFNRVFKKHNTQFRIFEDVVEGPGRYRFKVEITKNGRSRVFYDFFGNGGAYCPPKVKSATKPLQDFSYDVVFCDKPDKKNGSGYGFAPLGDQCKRICPQGHVLFGVGEGNSEDKCVPCSHVANPNNYSFHDAESRDILEQMSPRYSNSIANTDLTTNTCFDNNGCAAGTVYNGKNSQGKPDCRATCITVGESMNTKGACVKDPNFCSKAVKAIRRDLDWSSSNFTFKESIEKCKPKELNDLFKEFRDRTELKLADLERHCQKAIKDTKGADYNNENNSFHSLLAAKCSAPVEELSIPDAPLFHSPEAKYYFYQLFPYDF